MILTGLALGVFWLCAGAMAHTYLFYPLTLKLFRRRYLHPPVVPEGEWPYVALLIPAYNEEQVIGDKIQNSLTLDYPADRLEILVGSDGSTDRTDEIVSSFRDPRVKLIRLPGRSGKVGVYNRLVEETTAPVIAFSDANVTLDRAALRNLVRHFADPQVGCVNAGKYILIPAGAESVRGEALYGGLENRLRTRESEVGGMSGALGSLMAIRRELYRPYPRGSTNDDTVPALWATLAGMRNVHDPEAKAFEESGHNVREEFRRRVRIGAGNFQTLFRYMKVLHPRYGIAAYTFFSHKVLHWIFPFLMMGILVANVALAGHPVYRTLLILQGVGYGLASAGFLLDLKGWRVPGITMLYHFVALNIALLIGFFVYARGIRASTWERTPRA